jgi:hypothetical protein
LLCGERELEDEDEISSALEAQLVLLGFWPSEAKEDEEFITVAWPWARGSPVSKRPNVINEKGVSVGAFLGEEDALWYSIMAYFSKICLKIYKKNKKKSMIEIPIRSLGLHSAFFPWPFPRPS